MAEDYQEVELYIREDAHWHGKPLYEAVNELIRSRNIKARCMVFRGIAGCYENGEISTHTILDLSYHLPLKIEIILPKAETESILTALDEMVTDGVIAVSSKVIHTFRSSHAARKHS